MVIGGHDTSKAVWITSWQRSGSTWLAELLASPKGTRFVYEPANIADLCFEGAQAAMIAPPLLSPPHTAAVVKGLEGKVAHWWSDQFNRSHWPKRLVAKDVRGIGIAGTVAEQLDETPIIILIRNPIDVATSIVRLGWFDPSRTAHDAFVAEVSRWCEYHEQALRDQRLSRALWVSYEELRATQLSSSPLFATISSRSLTPGRSSTWPPSTPRVVRPLISVLRSARPWPPSGLPQGRPSSTTHFLAAPTHQRAIKPCWN